MKFFYTLLASLFVSIGMAQPITPAFDDIWIPMSDGDSLSADVFIPSSVTTGEVILIQTPYNKNLFEYSLPMGVGTDLDSQPFIFVVVDWRGFYGSSGADLSAVDRGQDAYDVCDWIVAQPWHGSRIGTWGPSALASIQYLLINKHHPNHTCAVPLVGNAHQSYDSYFTGGVLEEARLYQLDALGYGLSPIVLANHYDSPFWTIAENSSWYADDIEIPTLQIGGWYDHNIDKMMEFYTAARSEAAAGVQDEQWLLVGPWVHGGSGAAYVGSAIQGELSYPNAEYKSDTMAWEFLNYYLLDDPNGWNLTDQITYYELGTNQWLSTNDDDITATTNDIIYLNTAGRLTSEIGNDSTSFDSNPLDPTPTIGGANLSAALDQGPFNQSSLDSRSDVITFQSGVLTVDVTATGRIVADLWISSDIADCDIAVRLVDVYPDGRSMLITDGIHRMRFRNEDYTSSGEEFMSPGEIYNVKVKLPFTNYTWLTDHRIKIYISGNNSPRYNVNLQDGGPMYTTGTAQYGTISIHHNSTYPSQLILPGNNPSLNTEMEKAQTPLNLYPNPAINQINFNQNVNEIRVFNLSGQLLLNTTNVTNSLDISYLKNGVYIIQVTLKDGTVTQREFVKQ